MRRVLNNWLHWQLAYPRCHFGFHPRGNCWQWKFERVVFSNCVYWTFWRFFFAMNK